MVDKIWINVNPTAERAPFANPDNETIEILKTAEKIFTEQGANQAAAVVKKLRAWVTRTANPKVDRTLSFPTEEAATLYDSTFREVVARECNPATNGTRTPVNPLGFPKRAGFASPSGVAETAEILNTALAKFEGKKNRANPAEARSWTKAIKTIKNLRDWVMITANPMVDRTLSFPTEQAANQYDKTFNEVVAKQCGYKLFNLPVIERLNTVPGNVTQGATNVTVTVTGQNFPTANDIRIEFLNGSTRIAGQTRTYQATNQVDSTITIVPNSLQVSADKKTLTFRINVAENAPADNPTTTDVIENHRAVKISSILYGQKGLTKASDGILRVDPKAVIQKPQCSDGIDNDNDGLIDYPADPGCKSPAGNNEADHPKSSKYDVVHNRLKLQSDLLGNGGSIAKASDMRAGNVPAARTSVPNFSFRLGLGDADNPVTFRGRKNPVFGTPDAPDSKQQKRFELLGNTTLKYSGNYVGGNTHLLNFDARVMPRLHLANAAFIDGYADYNIEYNQFPASIANRYFFNGVRNTGVFGSAIETNFGTKSFSARLSVEGMIRGTHYEPETLGFKYFSHEQRLGLGLKLTLDRTLASKHPWAPYISAEVKANPVGRKEEPEHSVNGTIGSSFESLYALDGNLTLRFPKADNAPFAAFGISMYKQEGRKYDMEYRGAIGIDSKKAGAFTFNYFHRDNPGVYYGGEWNGYRLTYFMPNRELGVQFAADQFDRSWQFIGGLILSLGRTIIRQPVQVPASPSDRALRD